MTPAEIAGLRKNLFRKAKQLGAIREEAEDLAQEALNCFLRWKDGGNGSQLSHAITHAKGQIYGWSGSSKSAKVKHDYGEAYIEDLPPSDFSAVLNRVNYNPENYLIAAIDFLDALAVADPKFSGAFIDAEFSDLTEDEIRRRNGIGREGSSVYRVLFRRYLEKAMGAEI